MEEQVMWNILGREMTPYAVCVWVGCLLGLAVFCLEGRKLKPAAVIWTSVLGIALGLFGARLFYVLARLELFMDIGLNNFFRVQDEDLRIWGAAMGAAFWGAAGGAALAAVIAARITGEKTASVLDALAPAGALALAVSRFGEHSIGEGIGPEVTPESLRFFPIAVVNSWDEWNYALFMLEGIVSLVIFVLLMTAGRKYRDGYRARMYMILYSSSQIVLEALRRDSFLRWLFVRVNQVTAAAVLLILLAAGVLRWSRRPKNSRMPAGRIALCCALFALTAGAVIWLEFAIDKSPTLSVGLAYLLETICCAVFGVVTWQVVMKN